MNSVNFGTKKGRDIPYSNKNTSFRTKEVFLLTAKQRVIYAAGMLFITSVCLRIEAM